MSVSALLSVAGLALGSTAPLAPFAGTSAQDELTERTPPSEFHYEYVEANFAFGEFDGVQAGASFQLDGPWIAVARFELLDEDRGATDVDWRTAAGGVGYVHPLEPALDLVGTAEIEYSEIEVDNPAGNADDDEVGLRIRGGVRYRATEELDLEGGVSLRTVFDEDIGADGKILYHFDERIAGFVGLDVRDDDTLGQIGVRVGLLRHRLAGGSGLRRFDGGEAR